MYSGTQVGPNVSPVAFNNTDFKNNYYQHPNVVGPYPNYINNTPCLPPMCYGPTNQNAFSSNPADNRFPQHPKDQMHRFQPLVGLPVPPMNGPVPFPHCNEYFQFPPPLPSHPNSPNMVNHHLLPPPRGMLMNNFIHPPSHSSTVSSNNADKFNGKQFHPYRRNNFKFKQEKAESYHCGSCDKSFITQIKYDEHIAEHVGCGLDGCTFRAHPMIVEKHISMQHRTGLFKRIIKGNSPEEISKWIIDRKKHYPTQDKITEKQIQKDEMEKRGERYDDRQKQFGNRRRNCQEPRTSQLNNRNKKPDGFHNRKFNSHFNRTNRNTSSCEIPKSSAKKEPCKMAEEDYSFQRNLPAFRGTKYYLSEVENCDNQDFDSAKCNADIDFDVISQPENICQPSRSINSLDLIKGYDFSSDDSDEDTGEFSNSINSSMRVEETVGYETDSGPEECSSKPPVSNLILKDVSISTKFDNEDISFKKNSPGPEECSSKLPVPDFILKDLAVSTEFDNNDDISLERGSPGPEECSSKLPVPNFIVEDSSVSMKFDNNEDTSREGSSQEFTSKQINSKNECENNSDKSKRAPRKRKRAGNSKADENEEKVKTEDGSKQNSVDAFPRTRRYKRPTLLEKLLAPEIKRERNIILQCVRYVVNNNYFNIGSKTKID